MKTAMHAFRGEYASELTGAETPAGTLTVDFPDGLGSLVIAPEPQLGRTSVEIRVEREASESVVRVLESFANPARPFRFEDLPKEFREFSNSLDRELNQLASESVALVRWRFGLAGGHRAISGFKGIFWRSGDGTWARVPIQIGMVANIERTVLFSERALETVRRIWTGSNKEPVGHELWREAWAIQESAPRSALLIGVAALEVGVKEWIAQEIPETSWLMSEIPSPPAVRMLNEYAPKLLTLKGRPDRARQLPKDLVTRLAKGVKLRNDIAHAGAKVFASADLREFLYTVRDALYLLDSFAGRDWALDHVRRTTVKALRVPRDEGV